MICLQVTTNNTYMKCFVTVQYGSASDKFLCYSATRPVSPALEFCYTGSLSLDPDLGIRCNKLGYGMGTTSQCLKDYFPAYPTGQMQAGSGTLLMPVTQGSRWHRTSSQQAFPYLQRKKEPWRTTFFRLLPRRGTYHVPSCCIHQVSHQAMTNTRKGEGSCPSSQARKLEIRGEQYSNHCNYCLFLPALLPSSPPPPRRLLLFHPTPLPLLILLHSPSANSLSQDFIAKSWADFNTTFNIPFSASPRGPSSCTHHQYEQPCNSQAVKPKVLELSKKHPKLMWISWISLKGNLHFGCWSDPWKERIHESIMQAKSEGASCLHRTSIPTFTWVVWVVLPNPKLWFKTRLLTDAGMCTNEHPTELITNSQKGFQLSISKTGLKVNWLGLVETLPC